jgi:anti-sigma factor RsiW
MQCQEAVKSMHDYLDDDLPFDQLQELKLHMNKCPACHQRYEQLHKTLACIKYIPEEDVSDDFCQRIVKSLPKVKRLKQIYMWLKLHPVSSVASLCGVLFFGAWILTIDVEKKLVVKIPNEDSVVINGDHVLIPEDTVIHGDVFVQNGWLDLKGNIEGDLVIMNGDYVQFESAVVKGDIHEIDYAFERWLLQISDWVR